MDTVEESVTVALFREWLTQKSYSWSKLIDDVGEKKFDETIESIKNNLDTIPE